MFSRFLGSGGQSDAQRIGNLVGSIKNVNIEGPSPTRSLTNIYGRMKKTDFEKVATILRAEIRREKKWHNGLLFKNTPFEKRTNFILQTKLNHLTKLHRQTG